MKHAFLIVKFGSKKSFWLICAIFLTIYFIISNSNYLISINLNYIDMKTNQIDSKNQTDINNYHSTLVSAYFDIDRIGRPKEEYFEWIKQTLKLNAPFVFFVQKKYSNIILSLIQNRSTPYLIITTELNELPYYKDLDKVSQILASTCFRSKIEKNDRLETKNPLYSIVIYSKFHLLQQAALMNSFKTKKFIWVDAGISRFFADFDLTLPIRGTKIPNNKFFTVFESRAYFDSHFNNKDADNLIWSAKNYFLAGIMGGTLPVVSKVKNAIDKQWHKMITNGVVNNEQIALILSYFEQPTLFRLFSRSTLIVMFNSRDMKEIFSYLAL
jgi:hypothetical protein